MTILLIVVSVNLPQVVVVDSEGGSLRPRVLPPPGKQAGLFRVNARTTEAVLRVERVKSVGK